MLRSLVFLCLTTLVLLADSIHGADQEDSIRNNVLFIVVDDLRPALGCYNDPIAKTPNLDRLAARGMVFERAFCQQAVCSPSRLSMLTGRRPDSIKVWDLNTHFREHAPDIVTLPQLFKSEGYRTQSIGKIFHGNGAPARDPESWSEPPLLDVVRDANLRYALQENLSGSGLKRSATEYADVPDQTYVDGKTCELATDAIANLKNNEQPFFLAVGFRKPHLPFCAPAQYWDLYDREQFSDFENDSSPSEAHELSVRSWRELEGYSDIDTEGSISNEQKLTLRHGYYACVSYIDRQVGRLLDCLEENELLENTVIVVVGDHGFHLGEQGLWTKANNYELSTRVPLIVATPGVDAAGLRSDAIVELVDIYPSIAELCGLEIEAGLEGTSFVPLLATPELPWKSAAFSQFPRAYHQNRHKGRGDIMGYAIRTDRYRFIEWRENETNEVVASELYDHANDSAEMRNIGGDKAFEEVVRTLSEKLERGWRAARPDPKTTTSEREVSQPPLNVLFLAVDDMKDWVGCLNGYPGTVQTPNIDRLAARGMLFSNAHCPSPKCAPSRASILTGLRPSSTGLYDNGHWWLPNIPNVKTIPAHFRNHGYFAAGAGKIFHHTAGNNPPNQWDEFQRLVFRDDPWFRGATLNYPWSETSPFPDEYPFSGVSGLGHENDWGTLDLDPTSYDDHRTADYAIDFLGQDQDRPFFLACGLFRPHLPWYVPREYFELYPLDDIRLPNVLETDLDDLPTSGLELAAARRSDFATIMEADRWKEAVQAYLASISYADYQVGRVLDALDKSAHSENTIVVLWSDHGWHLGEKAHWHKSTLWEEATHVPLIIDVPGYENGVCERPVSLIDLFPTLIDLCTLRPISDHDGRSLTPLLRDANSRWPYPAVIEFRRGNAAIRSDRFRYIRYHDGGEELYDLADDPHEWHNLADDAEFEEVKSQHIRWLPERWAPNALTKNAFQFDPSTYSWTRKSDGKQFVGE